MADTSKPLVLVVDDDAAIGDLLSRYLSAQGLGVEVVRSSSALRSRIVEGSVDLVLLDLGLPDEDGISLMPFLRERWGGPIIIVSGRGESVDRVVGLELGADDYVTKPFDLRELLARIRAVLRRGKANTHAAGTPSAYEFDGYQLCPESRRLSNRDGVEIELTTGEFDLLLALVRTPSVVQSRDSLMNAVHGRKAGPYDRAIDVQIGRLRRKIEGDPSKPRLIKTVRGNGYTLATTVRRV